jgi:hypothetical protein
MIASSPDIGVLLIQVRVANMLVQRSAWDPVWEPPGKQKGRSPEARGPLPVPSRLLFQRGEDLVELDEDFPRVVRPVGRLPVGTPQDQLPQSRR